MTFSLFTCISADWRAAYSAASLAWLLPPSVSPLASSEASPVSSMRFSPSSIFLVSVAQGCRVALKEKY